MNTVHCHWLSSEESRALCCEGKWGEQGGLYLLCALPFNLCSQQNECLIRATRHPRIQHPADDSAPWRRGRGEKNKCWRDKDKSTDEERVREEETHGRSKSGKWRELCKHRCLSKDHCSCTKSGAVKPTPQQSSEWERQRSRGGKKVIWRADPIILDEQGWEP